MDEKCPVNKVQSHLAIMTKGTLIPSTTPMRPRKASILTFLWLCLLRLPWVRGQGIVSAGTPTPLDHTLDMQVPEILYLPDLELFPGFVSGFSLLR